jgi:hypothetical protein
MHRTVKRNISQVRQQHQKTDTYHNLHRTRPPVDGTVPLDEEVRIRLVDALNNPLQHTSIPRRAADIAQLEDHLQHLGDRGVGERGADAVVETGAVEVVRVQGAVGVDSGGIGEVVVLDA